MTKYRLKPTTKFKKDVKKLIKRGYDLFLLNEVIRILTNGHDLPLKYCDHPLKGGRIGYRDCHILNDWVLIYKIEKNDLLLVLIETGAHADIFG